MPSSEPRVRAVSRCSLLVPSLVALGLLLLAPPLPAQPTPLQGWTYTFDAQPLGDEWADPKFTKLTDGDKDPSHSVILGGGLIAVDITLPGPTRLEKLVAYVHRHNNNYKLRKLTVEALQAGQYVPVGENTNGFWGPTEQTDFALEAPLAVSAGKLRVQFITESIVSIQEIELFGQPAPPGSASAYQLPLNNAPGAHVSEVDADGDGRKEVVLENSFVRLIFQPDGGICRSMVLKSAGSEFVGGDERYGLFRDQLWSPDYSFADRLYFVNTGSDQVGAWVELRAQGVGGMMSFTEITKRIRLRPDSPAVSVHYALRNDPNSQTDYSYGFWAHHFLGVQGQNATYYFPTTEGVVEQPFEAGKPLEVWYRNPARGWAAYVGESGVGLAALMDYRFLNCFYMWAGSGTAIPTFEWRYNRVPVKAGQAFETDVTLLPIEGLKRVDGVVADVVGAITKDPTKDRAAVVDLYRPPGSQPAQLLIQVRALSDGAWQDAANLEMSQPRLSVSVAAPAAPACVVRGTVTRAGKALGFFERPLAWEEVKLAYKLEPLEQRIGETEPAEARPLPGHELSTAVETPHFKWAKPYFKGPIRALILCDDRHCREIIELWQRLDLDFQYVKYFSTYEKEWLWQGDRSILSLEAAQRRLGERLKQDYDVIIVSGLKWDYHFTPELRQAVAEKVKHGTGLVYIEPDGLAPDDELEGVCGMPDGEHRSLGWYGRWEPAAESYITSGLPWETLPRTRRMPFLEPPAGQVLANLVGDVTQPLVVAGSLGEGRVLTLTYDTLTHEPSYRGYSALLPAISYRGCYCLRDEMAPVTWQFWEHWYALLARCAVWASRKDSGIRFEGLAPTQDGKSLTGRLVGEVAADSTVQVVFRDRFSAEFSRAKAAVTPQAGEATIAVPLPGLLRAGQCFADLVLRDRNGATVAWAMAAFPGPKGPALKQLSIAKRTITNTEALWSADQPWKQVFRAREPFKLTCAVEPGPPAGAPLTLTARLTDCHDRLLFEQTKPAGGDEPVAFEASPPTLYNLGHRWSLELKSGDTILDTDHVEFIVLPPRDFRRFTFTSWGGQYLWRSQYLFDFVRRQVEDLGLDVAMNGITELGTGKVWWDYWQNISHSFLGVLSYMGPGVPDFMDEGFSKKAVEYAKTKDQRWLVREPCLNDPDYLSKVAEAIRRVQMPQVAEYGGAHDYCMGDEMSLTSYTTYFDYCFCDQTVAAFRGSLKQRYPSLDDLNRAWETSFASWDAVVPMTLDEVKGRANAAPWAEFRDFMTQSLADYYALVQRTIRESDSEARCGLSGTQEPKPGNGMDWWRDSLAFSYYHSYNTGWSDEMRRSFQPATGVLQSPYRCGYWQAGQDLEYQNFWCLTHDTKGISAWTTPLLFYGDLTLSESGADTRANMREMKAGLWDLIRSARRQHDGIAIHYSQPSINAALLMNKDSEIVQVRDAWVKLLEDLGLQYNFVSYRQIESGLLNNPQGDHDRYKVLLLPESIALSPKEVAEIKQFVRSGGAVIGDLCVGLLDDKCRRQPAGLLDDVFGIERTGKDEPLPVGVALSDSKDTVRLPAGESSVRAHGAAAHAGVPGTDVPALLTNTFGKGGAAYLNLNLAEFENERRFATPTEGALRSALLRILEGFGVRPPYPVTLASARPAHVEVIRYLAGPLEYLCLLRSSADDAPDIAKVPLGRRRHVYDVRAGKYLGQIDALTAPMLPGDCRVYCLAPAALGRTKCEAPDQAQPGGQLRYRLTLSAGSPGERQLIRVTVTRPDGKEAPDYARNHLLGAQPLETVIQLALNDPPGRWRLIARPLCTGDVSETSFELK